MSLHLRQPTPNFETAFQTSRDLETYEVVQLMPETESGEPQYRIKGLSSGTVRAVREAEIKSH